MGGSQCHPWVLIVDELPGITVGVSTFGGRGNFWKAPIRGDKPGMFTEHIQGYSEAPTRTEHGVTLHKFLVSGLQGRWAR